MKRVVMGTRPDGVADVLFEDDLQVGDAQQIRDLWLNRETPADVATVIDPTAGQALSHEPPDGGSVFRLIVFPPGSKVQWPTPEQMVEFHRPSTACTCPRWSTCARPSTSRCTAPTR